VTETVTCDPWPVTRDWGKQWLRDPVAASGRVEKHNAETLSCRRDACRGTKQRRNEVTN